MFALAFPAPSCWIASPSSWASTPSSPAISNAILRITEFLNGEQLDLDARPSAQGGRAPDRSGYHSRGNRHGAITAPPMPMLTQCWNRCGTTASAAPTRASAKPSRDTGSPKIELRAQLLWQLTVLRFIDQRFRPGVLVTDEEVRTYYDSTANVIRKTTSFDTLEPKIRSFSGGRAGEPELRCMARSGTQTKRASNIRAGSIRMSRRGKIVRNIAIGLRRFLVVVLVAAIVVVQTDWFRNFVKQKIIAATEEGTGGKVEIGSFDFDWHTPAGRNHEFRHPWQRARRAAPFVRAHAFEVDIRLFTSIHHMLDVTYLGIDKPAGNIIVFSGRPHQHSRIRNRSRRRTDRARDRSGSRSRAISN